jgi:lysophospholipase L1-like esterase
LVFISQFFTIHCKKPGNMANHTNAPLFGLPGKTFRTMLWLALFGGAAATYQLITRPSNLSGAESSLNSSSWNDPVAAVSTDLEGDEINDDKVRTAVRGVRAVHQSIEDPSRSLCSFYAALKRLDTESADKDSVRILHYGDSILTTDQLSGTVRRRLQARFGDGGQGFVLLGKPWLWHHHLDVVHGANDKWRIRPLSSDPTADGLLGLGAVAFETAERGASAWVGSAEDGGFGRTVASFDISYLSQPRGGTFDIYINSALKQSVCTAAYEKKAVHYKIQVTPGSSKLTLKTKGDGPVRLFGAVLESGAPGIEYDSLAVNGIRISSFEKINRHHFQTELQHRNPNLIIMMCGANEGNNDALALSAYKDQLTAVLTEIREAVPNAGCLVMGPLDQAVIGEFGDLESRKMPKKLTAAQRETAHANGCAFFDTFSAMGGTGSMPKWVKRGLVGGDFIHPSDTGARMIGGWLSEALLAGYESFVVNGETCESNVTSL